MSSSTSLSSPSSPLETARFDLKVRPGIERKNPRDNTSAEVAGPRRSPDAPSGLDDPLALRFSRPVMNSNEWKNTKVPAAATKFLAQVSSRRFEPLRIGVPRLRTGKRNGRSVRTNVP